MRQEIHRPNCLWIGYCSCREGTPHWVTSPGPSPPTLPSSRLFPPAPARLGPEGCDRHCQSLPRPAMERWESPGCWVIECRGFEIMELIEHTQLGRKAVLPSGFTSFLFTPQWNFPKVKYHLDVRKIPRHRVACNKTKWNIYNIDYLFGGGREALPITKHTTWELSSKAGLQKPSLRHTWGGVASWGGRWYA